MLWYEQPKGPYLTESILGEYLKILFPEHEFIHNKVVPNSGIKNRPDYRNDDLMLIIEFDGNRHYQQLGVISTDRIKDMTYGMMGYKVVRIPYFVQFSTVMIKHYFNIDVEWEQTYPHGFIDKSAVLPCDFNDMGYDRYMSQVHLMPFELAESIQGSELDKTIALLSKEIALHQFEFDVTEHHPDSPSVKYIRRYVPWFRTNRQVVCVS